MSTNNKILTITPNDDFSFRECLWFLDRNLDDCMHRVKDGTVYKAVRIQGLPVVFAVSGSNKQIEISVLSDHGQDLTLLCNYVRKWFDLDRNAKDFYKLLKKDGDLKVLLKYKGLKLTGIPDLFETLCWCVIGQQINLSFAYQVKRQLVERFGEKLSGPYGELFLFPEPEVLAEIPIDTLRQLKLTTRKSEYITGIANAFVKGEINQDQLEKMKEEEIKNKLLSIRGIGPWTANYATMKTFRGMNCVPYGDSGINQALTTLKGINEKNKPGEVALLFSNFKGWQSYLVYYLWRSLRHPENEM